MNKMYLIKDNEEEVLFKKLNDGENISSVSDSIASKTKTKDSTSKKRSLFILATVADKEINGRIYPNQHVKATVDENKWTKKYNKPLKKDHWSYGEAFGRVIAESYIRHADLNISGAGVPSVIIDELASKNFLNEGTGSVILKLYATDEVIEDIKQGKHEMASSSSYTDGMTCNICKSDYFDCNHRRGVTYEVDGKNVRCVPETKALYPVEISLTDDPANDTSITIIFDEESKTIIRKDFETLQEESNKPQDNQKNKNKVNDNKEKNKDKTEENEMKLSDSEKKLLAMGMIQKMGIEDEKEKQELEAILTDVAEGKVEALISIVDFSMKKKYNDKDDSIITEKDNKITELETKVSDLTTQKTSLEENVLFSKDDVEKIADENGLKELKTKVDDFVAKISEKEKFFSENNPNSPNKTRQTETKDTKTKGYEKELEMKDKIKETKEKIEELKNYR